MIKVETDDHIGVYLDHCQLINTLYNSDACVSKTSHLNPLLFNFTPRVPTSVNSGRKRKRKAENLSPDVLSIKNSAEVLINKLKSIKAIATRPSTDSAERIWEAPISFPQMKGSNNTYEFQNFTLNDVNYLIPPNCIFFNCDLRELGKILPCLPKYDFVVLDPPWWNKYIRRIKKAKQELGYKMLNNEALLDIPLDKLIHCNSVIAIWCTNSKQHQDALLEQFMPHLDLVLVHKIVWLKLNTDGDLIGEFKNDGKKQPFEVLFIACHRECLLDFSELKKVEMILSIPSVIHSHKPPILEIFRDLLPPNPKCLELFARYLQPNFTSIGLEVLKLMDVRLYT